MRYLFRFIGYPVIMFIYISTPRIISSFSGVDWKVNFTSSYYNLNAELAVLIAMVSYLLTAVNRKLSATLLSLVLGLLFIIRAVDAKLMEIFGFSFSPEFFAHLTLETFLYIFSEYWLTIALSLLSVGGVLYLILKINFWENALGRPHRVALVVAAVLAMRSAYIIHSQKHRSHAVFATQAFAEQVFAYYARSTTITKIQFNPAEVQTLSRLGYEFNELSYNRDNAPRRNLIVVFLEGFNASFTEIGGSEHKGLTPNLDRFSRRFTYADNFYNAAYPTLNGIISSYCGLITDFNNSEMTKTVGSVSRAVCVPDILSRFGYQSLFISPIWKSFAGIDRFFEIHHFDTVMGKSEIAEIYPGIEEKYNKWGLYDQELFQVAIDQIERFSSDRPFLLSLITDDTHVPYFVSPDCQEIYRQGDNMLNAIHCSDKAIGWFIDALEKRGYLKNSVILFVADHISHSSKTKFGKIFLAFHSPDLEQRRHISLNGFTPDVAPTLLELLGIELNSMYIGKSLLSSREKYQHLIAPTFEIFRGKFIQTKRCQDDETLIQTKVLNSDRRLTPCEREKVGYFQKRWLMYLDNQ